ncbi:MAG: hypothetical protein IJW59_02330 [Clostridia bacterium]|nr:hypothetical protein [Clostridia bacterium]
MDKRKLNLLRYLLNKCDNGYKVLEVSKILVSLRKYKNCFEFLHDDLMFLNQYKYIDVKYVDEESVCLSILDNSRIFQENLKSEKGTRRGYITSLIINMLFSGIMAFIGAFLAIIITR